MQQTTNNEEEPDHVSRHQCPSDITIGRHQNLLTIYEFYNAPGAKNTTNKQTSQGNNFYMSECTHVSSHPCCVYLAVQNSWINHLCREQQITTTITLLDSIRNYHHHPNFQKLWRGEVVSHPQIHNLHFHLSSLKTHYTAVWKIALTKLGNVQIMTRGGMC